MNEIYMVLCAIWSPIYTAWCKAHCIARRFFL